MTKTPLLGIEHMTENQGGAHVKFNEAMKRIELALSSLADSAPPAGPPGNPQAGVVYVVPEAATEDWSTFKAGNLAKYENGWVEITPWNGLTLWDEKNQRDVRYNAGTGKWDDVQHASIADMGVMAFPLDFGECQANDQALADKLNAILLALRSLTHIAPLTKIVKVMDETVSVNETNVDLLNP